MKFLLAIPMKINRLTAEGLGVGELDGSQHEVDLSLIENPAVGDFMIVHAGYAIEKLDTDEANERIRLFEELAELYAASPLAPIAETATI